MRLTQDGDIRRRDRMKLAEADQQYKNDATRPYGHAFKAIEAYQRWLAAGDIQARRQLSVLRLLGLFDRVASADCLAALRAEPVIEGLNDDWQNAEDKDWKLTLGRLQEINLIGLSDAGDVDCHPLVREYIAEQLKEKNPEAFQSGHSRLFDHLCETTAPRPDTLTGLQPLYQAVTHGCLAGRQQEACDKVFYDRIQRGGEAFSTKKLGAIGAGLGAVASFFDSPWLRLSLDLREADQAWLLNEAAFSLRALGRLTEAREPMRISGEMDANARKGKGAAISYSNLTELEVTLGFLDEAVADGRLAVEYADRLDDKLEHMAARTTVADALHQRGDSRLSLRESRQDFRIRVLPKLLASFATEIIFPAFLSRRHWLRTPCPVAYHQAFVFVHCLRWMCPGGLSIEGRVRNHDTMLDDAVVAGRAGDFGDRSSR